MADCRFASIPARLPFASRVAQFTSGAKFRLNRYGAKYFSQATRTNYCEIVKRLGITAGTFAELGVGGGLENNTLILLANGWRGFWIGKEDLAFDHRLNPKRLTFLNLGIARKLDLVDTARPQTHGNKRIGCAEVACKFFAHLIRPRLRFAGLAADRAVSCSCSTWRTMRCQRCSVVELRQIEA